MYLPLQNEEMFCTHGMLFSIFYKQASLFFFFYADLISVTVYPVMNGGTMRNPTAIVVGSAAPIFLFLVSSVYSLLV